MHEACRSFDAYQDVVRLDISVHDIAIGQQLEGQEELTTVDSHCANVEPNVFAETLDHITQVHAAAQAIETWLIEDEKPDIPQRFEDQAKVTAVLEGSFKTHNMILVARVSLLEPVKDQDFFLAGAMPRVSVSKISPARTELA